MIDTHCHIDDPQYQADLPAFLQRQRQGGVERILVPGVDLNSVTTVRAVCAAAPGYLLPAIGLHPEEVRADWSQVLDQMEEHLHKYSDWIAIGEIGLDYHFDTTYRAEQQLALRRQLDWALSLDLPVMIHSRDATDDCLSILEEYTDRGLRGVMHCFSGSRETAERILRMGLVLGIGGVITFKNCHLAEALAASTKTYPNGIPLSSLVLETDAPYMAPVPHRGKPNESAWMMYVVDKLAETYQIDKSVVISVTNATSRALFELK